MTEENFVLIVDDNKDIHDLLTALLETFGLEARTACNGLEALEVMEKATPKVIFLDVMMPGMDGLSLLTKIRADRSIADVPVILFSAVSDLDRFTKLGGVSHVLQKSYINVANVREALVKVGALPEAS
ncbi:MAG: response regulator [Chloroflexi bacterium]|nr:response regulator [Chloroflexota bacterium]